MQEFNQYSQKRRLSQKARDVKIAVTQEGYTDWHENQTLWKWNEMDHTVDPTFVPPAARICRVISARRDI